MRLRGKAGNIGPITSSIAIAVRTDLTGLLSGPRPSIATKATRFGVARDITEERRAAESLRESEQRFRIMADSCPTIIWVTDAHGGTWQANRVCQEFFGALFEQTDGEQARRFCIPTIMNSMSGHFGTP